VHEGTIPAHFDAVYWDTFSEDYQALKHFFDNVFDLLSGPTARFSWFHGMLSHLTLNYKKKKKRVALSPLHPPRFKFTQYFELVRIQGSEPLRVPCTISTPRWPRWTSGRLA
jgi:protein arginine N-methyltransferase 2